MSEESTTTESTVKKKTATKAAPKKQSKVHFYFPKSAGASYTIQPNVGKLVRFKAKNHILTLDPSIPSEKSLIERLKKDPQNRENGGTKFVKVDSISEDTTDKASQIDRLLEMDASAIVTMLGGEIELRRLTKGGLIAKVLELK